MAIDPNEMNDMTLSQLYEWLGEQDVDTSQWGDAGAKAVVDLWNELQHGESTLHTDPPLRRVHVVEVLVRDGDQLLIEREQHFSDGRVRMRNRPPSEKMLPDEQPEAAALRCLREELGVEPAAISFALQEITKRTVRMDSGSYPNLCSEYHFYTVAASVDGLPHTTFTTANAAHAEGDPIVAHQWAWVDYERG